MNRLIGTVAAFFLAAGLGSGLDPSMMIGGVNAFVIVIAAAGLGFVLGAIADYSRVSATGDRSEFTQPLPNP